jgi:hypothetical protein
MSVNLNTLPSLYPDTVKSLLDQIDSLQKSETILVNDYSKLKNQYSPEAANVLIKQINDLSSTRDKLYKVLSGIKTYFDVSTYEAKKTITAQKMAVMVMEQELNNMKKRYNSYLTQRETTLRMIELTNYNNQVYEDKTIMVKTFIYTLIPLFFLIVAYKMQLLSTTIYFILCALIVCIGGYFMVNQALAINNLDSSLD